MQYILIADDNEDIREVLSRVWTAIKYARRSVRSRRFRLY